MSTENKISLKRWISKNQEAAGKLNHTDQAASAILQMSADTGIPEIFIRQNLKQIKNWI